MKHVCVLSLALFGVVGALSISQVDRVGVIDKPLIRRGSPKGSKDGNKLQPPAMSIPKTGSQSKISAGQSPEPSPPKSSTSKQRSSVDAAAGNPQLSPPSNAKSLMQGGMHGSKSIMSPRRHGQAGSPKSPQGFGYMGPKSPRSQQASALERARKTAAQTRKGVMRDSVHEDLMQQLRIESLPPPPPPPPKLPYSPNQGKAQYGRASAWDAEKGE